LPLGEKPTEELRRLGETATTKARIYVDYKGTEANTGSIIFSTMIFNIIWSDDKIFDVSSMEYGKCVKCLTDTFEEVGDIQRSGRLTAHSSLSA